MKRLVLLCSLLTLPLAAQQYKIAIAGLTHAHVSGHLGRILKSDQVKRPRELETENERLQKAVSDPTLEKLILKEAASQNW